MRKQFSESDYAKFVITKIEAIEVVLDTVETLEEWVCPIVYQEGEPLEWHVTK